MKEYEVTQLVDGKHKSMTINKVESDKAMNEYLQLAESLRYLNGLEEADTCEVYVKDGYVTITI